MKGKHGTSMGVVHRRKRRNEAPVTRGGPVTITRADGTTEVRAPYTGPELKKITAKKRARRTG